MFCRWIRWSPERHLVGFKVVDSMSIRQAIQNPIQEKLLSEVKCEKVNCRKIRHFPGFQKGDNFTTFSTDVFTIGFEHLLTLKMALLLDLSNKLLIEIILCLAQYGLLWVKKLSYTCKRLNACCAPWIFKTYRLGLPVNSSQLSQSRFNTIAARLQNFSDKASYVQDLTLR
jgi:hypothetical protein